MVVLPINKVCCKTTPNSNYHLLFLPLRTNQHDDTTFQNILGR